MGRSPQDSGVGAPGVSVPISKQVQHDALLLLRPYLLALSVPAGLFFLPFEFTRHEPSPLVIVALAFVLLLGGGVGLARSHRWRSLSLSIGLVGLTVFSMLHWGLTLGVGLLGCGATISASFFHGKWGAIVVIGCLMAATTVTAIGHTGGWLDVGFAPPDTVGWVRAHVLWALCLGAISFTLIRVVHELEAAVEREAEARTEQRAAEAERLRTLEAAMRSQRLETAGQLASGVAHDFNNALQVLQGTLELLALEPDQDQRDSLAEEGLSAIEGASATARQLLDIARPASQTEAETCDPLALLEGLASRLRRVLPAGIELRVSVQACPTVPVARGTLEQIMLNLIINARDAIEGSGQIVIGCASAPDGAAELWVIDTGSGMDEQTKARLFEPFFTTKGPQRGTGLGLSMVHSLVNRTGGVIEVDSNLGDGTRFTLRWASAGPARASRASITQTVGNLDDTRVLLVEDNLEAARVMARGLAGAGYMVTTTSDVHTAEQLLDEQEFDLIACDGLLPDGSALDLVEIVDRLAVTPGFLVFSGYPRDERVAAAAARVGAEVLAKPFSAKELVRACTASL